MRYLLKSTLTAFFVQVRMGFLQVWEVTLQVTGLLLFCLKKGDFFHYVSEEIAPDLRNHNNETLSFRKTTKFVAHT